MLRLSEMKTGQKGKVKLIKGGQGIIQRLAGMGILPGTEIAIVRAGGPAILNVLGHRLSGEQAQWVAEVFVLEHHVFASV